MLIKLSIQATITVILYYYNFVLIKHNKIFKTFKLIIISIIYSPNLIVKNTDSNLI